MLQAFKKVFRNTAYQATAVFVALGVFLVSVYAQNLALVGSILSSSAGVGAKAKFLFSLLGGIHTNATLLSATNIIVLSVLFGVNISMMVYVIKRNRAARNSVADTGRSLSGIVFGALGIGCSACGSLILTPLLASFGASGFLAALPLKGTEFGFVGVILLIVSIWFLGKKINDPLVCPVE